MGGRQFAARGPAVGNALGQVGGRGAALVLHEGHDAPVAGRGEVAEFVPDWSLHY